MGAHRADQQRPTISFEEAWEARPASAEINGISPNNPFADLVAPTPGRVPNDLGALPPGFILDRPTGSGKAWTLTGPDTASPATLLTQPVIQLERAKALLNVVKGTAEKLVPGQQSHEGYANAVGSSSWIATAAITSAPTTGNVPTW
jgi:hypothetical protein